MSVNISTTPRHPRFELIAAVSLAIFAGVGVFWWLTAIYAAHEPVAVVVAATDLKAPVVLKRLDLAIVRVPREALPETGVVDLNQAVGQVLTRSLSRRQVLTKNDLIYERDPDSEAALVPSGKIGMVVPGTWLASFFPRVKKNDFVSIYVAWPPVKVGLGGSGALLRNILVLSVSADKDGVPHSLLLALDENGVERLTQAHASQLQLVVVAESAQTVSVSAVPSSTPR